MELIPAVRSSDEALAYFGQPVSVHSTPTNPFDTDISTRDKFRAALLAAKAVGLQDPDPAHHSGVVVRQMLVDLGILDPVMKSAVIIKELEEVRDRYGDARRTQIIDESTELQIEDLIAECGSG